MLSYHNDPALKAGKIAHMRAHIEFTGFILAGVGWLMLLIQLAGLWRFGSLDEWFYQATLPGTTEQWLCLAYLLLTVICLSAKE